MTQDEYTDRVLQLVKTNLDAHVGHITVALLAERLHRMELGLEWKKFGFRGFLPFLKRLEEQQSVELVKTPKDAWAVRPGAREASAEVNRPAKSYNPLRKPVWGAFVQATPTGRRFINRTNGDVRMGLQEPPSPVDEWIEVSPIPEAEQKGWAHAFLLQNVGPNNGEASAALEGRHWHREFPEALGRVSYATQVQWNRLRSFKVSETVENWSTKHLMPPEHLFLSGKKQEASAALVQTARPSVPSASVDQQRAWVLAALAMLPTDRLLEISLPAGLLLNAIQASSSASRD